MSVRVESDEWGTGPSILADSALAALRTALEQTPVIVEHRFYRGSRSPVRLVFDDFSDLELYFRHEARPGDSITTWRYDASCRDDNALVHGKLPDTDGLVPQRGAY